MDRILFLCGCEANPLVDRENVKTMDTVEFDEDGFLTCKIHGSRRQGWRSIPALPGMKLGDWSFAHMTPLQREAFVVFHEEPNIPKLNLK